jgi:hypothetical protein
MKFSLLAIFSLLTYSVHSVNPPYLNENGFDVFYPNCYLNDHQPRILDIGVIVDTEIGLDHNNNQVSLRHSAEKSMHAVKFAMYKQLNIIINLKEVRVHHLECDKSYNMIETLRGVVGNNTPNGGISHWHLLTKCLTPGSGIGYLATLCKTNNYNVAISAYSSKDWRVFGHELGHAIGAYHSFEEGKKKTGGIMDYGINGTTKNGMYQFNIKYRRDEICNHIDESQSKCLELGAMRLLDNSGSCGNTIIDSTEECECKDFSKSCDGCENCVKTKTCGDSFITSNIATHPLCCSSGEFTIGNDCDTGTCSDGMCLDHCKNTRESLDYCGIINNCVHKCRSVFGCYDLFIGDQIGVARYGTKCLREIGVNGICDGGVCVQDLTGIPTNDPTTYTTQFPTNTPTNYPTQFPSRYPTDYPTIKPTGYPTQFPTNTPTGYPTQFPSRYPTDYPTIKPTGYPTQFPTNTPTGYPTMFPNN